MALPIGKLTILVGAGILGSVLAKEGRMPNVSGLFSGAFKVALKQIKQDDSMTSTKKPQNDALFAQVNSLREELQMLASSRPLTIVTSSGSGSGRYTVVVVIVVVGYGYIWWKGWKLPDMMFATRRSLSEAQKSIAKQLESVYSSIAAAKRHFSAKLDGIDHTLDDIRAITESTDNEVSALRERTDIVSTNVKSFQHAVREMESKIKRIEGKQDTTNEGLRRLCNFAWNLESKTIDHLQASPSSSSRPALEPPPVIPQSMIQQPPRGPVSTSGLREFNEISETGESSKSQVSNGIHAPENTNNGSSSSGIFGLKFPRASFLSRTRSVATSFNLSSHTGTHLQEKS